MAKMTAFIDPFVLAQPERLLVRLVEPSPDHLSLGYGPFDSTSLQLRQHNAARTTGGRIQRA